MASNEQPLVSIGVPVYNGALLLAGALDSLLAQDYRNLEVIISDNGSTDSTPEICARYAERDSRVRVYRSEDNKGLSWNFNRVFSLARGTYFMWAAHDDQRHSSFVSACVERLEASPRAALCQTHTAMYIQGRPEPLCVATLDSFEGMTGVVARYRETLKRFPATAFYGLYRTSAVRQTHVFERHIATDVAFVQELSLYGEFVQVPRILFDYYGRPKWNTVQQDYRAIYGREMPRFYFPFAVLFWSHCRRVAASSMPLLTKVALWSVLALHEVSQLARKVLFKIAGQACPERWRERVAVTFYMRALHSSNVRVSSTELFVERVIKPTLGWWPDA